MCICVCVCVCNCGVYAQVEYRTREAAAVDWCWRSSALADDWQLSETFVLLFEDTYAGPATHQKTSRGL